MGELSEGAYITTIGTVVCYPLRGVSDNLRILSSVSQELILNGAHVPEITIIVIRGITIEVMYFHEARAADLTAAFSSPTSSGPPISVEDYLVNICQFLTDVSAVEREEAALLEIVE
jgi:hypothetical protein